MADYPNPDEEFELMYGDDLEVLREMEGGDSVSHQPGSKSRKSLNFATPTNSNKSKVINTPQLSEPEPSTSQQADLLENSFERDFRRIDTVDFNLNKRKIEALFGDIDDLLSEERKPKKKKTEAEEEAEKLDLIEKIVNMRKSFNEKQNPELSISRKSKSISDSEHLKNNVSRRVPQYPFLPITTHNGERLYIRTHSEEYFNEDVARVVKNCNFVSGIGRQSKELWRKAHQILNAKIESHESNTEVEEIVEVEETDNSKLWVDLYKPRKYLELLSDESTNRTLLKWMKLWDKVVFKRRPKEKHANKIHTVNQNDFKYQKKELNTTLDEHDRPLYKVALLCGPPGLGKTTLAHMVAKHAGYNVVEINASDDRSVEAFKKALETATQMKSVLDRDNRPNCLIFDEIDGAPATSIDFLIKFVNGTVVKPKKGKKEKPAILKRPIICICNDVYVPALRPLRQIAFILNFPPIPSSRLAERLMEIAQLEKIETDFSAMLALSEKSNNDIRSCLAVLNFYKLKNEPITITDISDTNIGQKDVQKGLFTIWNDIFEVKVKKNSEFPSLRQRMQDVVDFVSSFGDYDRLSQGVFENYPLVKRNVPIQHSICTALEWFSFNDCMSRQIQETQNYTMWSYLPFSFAAWHFAFASSTKKKIVLPNTINEVNAKQAKQISIISEILRGISPALRPYVSADSLRLDILPAFADILIPNFRTINVTLHASHEKSQISNVVNIMIDYNLTYVQERNAEGTYIYNIDPNIDEIINYQGLKVQRKTLSYTSKQLLGREIEIEKMRRFQNALIKNEEKCDKEKTKKNNSNSIKEGNGNKNKENENSNKPVVPNHLQKLTVKSVNPKEVVVKDFFGRVITKAAKSKFGESSEQLNYSNVWYKFKEGYSNAVRRKVKMSTFLKKFEL